MRTRRVALYGHNVVMSAIGASLKRKPEFQVLEIGGSLSELIEALDALPPDAILFDLAGAEPSFAVPLLRKHPTMLLIGVDLASHKMLVLSGEHSRLLTEDDLIQVIEAGGA